MPSQNLAVTLGLVLIPDRLPLALPVQISGNRLSVCTGAVNSALSDVRKLFDIKQIKITMSAVSWLANSVWCASSYGLKPWPETMAETDMLLTRHMTINPDLIVSAVDNRHERPTP